MLQQQNNTLVYYGFYTEGKVGKTGLTVTIDVFEHPSGTPIVSGGSVTELGGGLYYYALSNSSVDADVPYPAIFKTATTSVDQQHIPALWVVGAAWVNRVDENVSAAKTLASGAITAAVVADGAIDAGAIASDAITSAKIADGALTAAKFASGAFDAVWTVAARTLTSFGTLAADIWASATRTITGGTITTNNDKTGYSLVNGAITAAVIATDAIDADALAASAVTEIAAGVASGGMSNPITYTYTVYEADGATPLSDVTVWVSTDGAGTNVVASGTTDNFGEVEFQLDAGTYYVFRQKAGWNFTNPDTEVVS